MHYRRVRTPGATYFFTVVTYKRRPLFGHPHNVALLREAFRTEMQCRPFVVDAIVVLPDHIHAVWTLPETDADFSMRWRQIKRRFTQTCAPPARAVRPASRVHKGEQAVWQRRFWEHQIRDERDLQAHVEYIHYNPVKHGLVTRPAAWPYSSFHRYVRQGIYEPDWGASEDIVARHGVGRE